MSFEFSENSLSDDAQIYLDRYTSYIVRQKGGDNHLHAKFISETSKVVVGSTNPVLDELQSDVRIDDTISQWNKAYRVVLAFLRKHQMTETLHVMRQEYPNVPKQTGFSKSNELDHYFHKLIQTNLEVTQYKTVQDKIEEFSELLGMKYVPETEPAWTNIELSTVPDDQELSLSSTTMDSTLDDNIEHAQEEMKNWGKKRIKVKVPKEPQPPQRIRVRVRKHNENGETYVHQHERPKDEIIGTRVVKTTERKVSPGGTPRVITKTKIIKLKPHYVPPPKGYYASKSQATTRTGAPPELTNQSLTNPRVTNTNNSNRPQSVHSSEPELEDFDFGTSLDNIPKITNTSTQNTNDRRAPIIAQGNNQMNQKPSQKDSFNHSSQSKESRDKLSNVTPNSLQNQRRSLSVDSFPFQSDSDSDDDEIMTLPENHSPSALDKLQMFIDDASVKKPFNTLDGDNPVFRRQITKNRTLDGFVLKKPGKRYKDGTLMRKRINDPIARVARNSITSSGEFDPGYSRHSTSGRASNASRSSTRSISIDSGSHKSGYSQSGSYYSSDYSID